ncbi:hypothetical protein HK405_003004 [Cladochytrium tenue]|nr:hypothetical protein HK405_003004 [Cladochytrium tenue]
MPASSPAFGSPEEADDRLRSALAGPVKPSATASAKATEPLPAAAATSGPAGLSATAASSSKSWAQLARQAFLSPPESSEPSVSSSGTASPEHLPRVLRVNAGSEDVHADSHSEQTGLEVGDSTSDSLSVSADSTAASGGEIRPPVLHGIPGVLNLQHGEENKVDKPSTTASDTGSVISQADESLSSATLKEASTQPVGNVWKMRMQQQQQQSPSHSLKLEASSKVSQQTDGESGSFRPFNHTRRRPQYSGVRSGVHDQNGPSKEVQSEDLVDEDGFVRVQRKKPHASGAAKDGKPHYHNHYQGHTHGASSSVQQKPGRKEAEKVETKLQPTQVATGSGTDPDKTAAPTLDSGAIGDTPVPTSAEDRKVPIDTQKPVVPKKPSTPAAAKIVQVNARSENLLKESTTSRDAPAGILSGAWPSLDQSLNTSSAVPVSVAVQSSPAVASHTTAESTPQSRPNPHGRKSWKKLDVPIRYPPPPSVAARKEATLDRRRLSVEGSVKSVSSSTTSSRQDKTKLKVADVTEPAGSVSNASEGIGSVLEDDGNEAQTGVAQSEVSESITQFRQKTTDAHTSAIIRGTTPMVTGSAVINAASQLMYGQQQLTPNPFPQAQIANGNLNNAPVPDVIVPPGETVPVPVSSVDLDTCVSWIRRQVEYYFSIENLCRDLHLRAQMSPVSGAVPLRVVAGFSRVRSLVAVARAKSEAAARAQSKQQQQQEQLQQQQAKDQTGETTPAKSAVESTTESMEAEQPVSTAAAPSKSSGAPLSAAPKTRGLDWAVGLIIDALAGSATVDVVELAADDWPSGNEACD